MAEKLKLALYWAASCGGCEIAIVELREKLLIVDQVADILFWPVAIDAKYKDVEAMPDGHIDVCLFNGAIRTSENEHLAHLLRKKSKVLVAFGSCANEGCMPGLANLYDRQSIFDYAYLESPSTDNPDKVVPQTQNKMPEGEIQIPKFYQTVKTLPQTVDVDYHIPGCPPQAPQIWAVIEAIVQGKLPAKGSVVGANEKTVCDECKHDRKEKAIKQFYRTYEIIPSSTAVPLRPGPHLRGAGDPRRVRRPLHEGRCALPRLLRSSAPRGRPGRGLDVRLCLRGRCGHGRGSGPHRRRYRRPHRDLLPLRPCRIAPAPAENIRRMP